MVFQKGQVANPKGRPKGAVNRLTGDGKAMIHEAIKQLGGVAWLVSLGRDDPSALASLFGRTLPREIVAEIEHDVNLTVITGVPGPSK